MNESNDLTIIPFVFQSSSHQRYENNVPVLGLQKCLRTISVEKNINGCRGYRLSPGIGYIVKIFNNDLEKPQMSDKPMLVVNKTFNKIELRGYPIEAQGPFGWVYVDYRDYGLTVFYKNDEVEKCVLHMFDRNIDIEYMSFGEQSDNKTFTERFIDEAIKLINQDFDGEAVYFLLYTAWKAYCNNPSDLNKIQNDALYAQGLLTFLTFGTITDIDIKQQISSIAYLFVSKAIEKHPSNINNYKNRLLIMALNKDAFEYTVSSVVNEGKDFFELTIFPFVARDSLFKMIYADFSVNPTLQRLEILNRIFMDLEAKVNSGFFGKNETKESIISSGKKLHNDVIMYLKNKVLKNTDIDF